MTVYQKSWFLAPNSVIRFVDCTTNITFWLGDALTIALKLLIYVKVAFFDEFIIVAWFNWNMFHTIDVTTDSSIITSSKFASTKQLEAPTSSS